MLQEAVKITQSSVCCVCCLEGKPSPRKKDEQIQDQTVCLCHLSKCLPQKTQWGWKQHAGFSTGTQPPRVPWVRSRPSPWTRVPRNQKAAKQCLVKGQQLIVNIWASSLRLNSLLSQGTVTEFLVRQCAIILLNPGVQMKRNVKTSLPVCRQRVVSSASSGLSSHLSTQISLL